MPNWRKLVVSGSDANLNSLEVNTYISASGYNITSISSSLLKTDANGSIVPAILDTDYVGPDSILPILQRVKNVSGTTLYKGTPLAVVTGSTSGNISDVVAADAGNPNAMPALYILNQDLADEAEGLAIVEGPIVGVNTSAYQSGTKVYVAVGGGWTSTRPTGSALVQFLGVVTKQHASNGGGEVHGPGNYNELPNIPQGFVWVGNKDGVPVAVSTASLGAVMSATASYALTASYLDGFIESASYAAYALSSSYSLTASFIDPTYLSASIAAAGFGGSSVSASYATTASYVNLKGKNITIKYVSGSIQLTGSTGGTSSTGGLQELLQNGNVASGTIELSGSFNAYNVYDPDSGGSFRSLLARPGLNGGDITAYNDYLNFRTFSASFVSSYVGMSSKLVDAYVIGKGNSYPPANTFKVGVVNSDFVSNVRVTGSLKVKGDVTINGKITAKEFHTTLVSASILYKSGSTKFGNTNDDRHEFTGSVFIKPNLYVAATASAGHFIGDGSGLTGVKAEGYQSTVYNFSNQNDITVPHGLISKNINVVIYDDQDNMIIPEQIQVATDDEVYVKFSQTTSGRVVLTRGGHVISGSLENSITSSYAIFAVDAISASHAERADYALLALTASNAQSIVWTNIDNVPALVSQSALTAATTALVQNIKATGSFTGSFYGDGSNLTNLTNAGILGYGFGSNSIEPLPNVFVGKASGSFSAILGGLNNTIGRSGYGGIIAGGILNTVTNTQSTALGSCNTNNGQCSGLVGNTNNAQVSSLKSFRNTSFADASEYFNARQTTGSYVLGRFSRVEGTANVVVGQSNLAYGDANGAYGQDLLVMGTSNYSIGWCHSILKGFGFGASNLIGNITAGGWINVISGSNYSGIFGGTCNRVVGHDKAFIVGSNLTSRAACTTHMNNVWVQGSVSATSFSGSFTGNGSALRNLPLFITTGSGVPTSLRTCTSGSDATAGGIYSIALGKDANTSGNYSSILGGRFGTLSGTYGVVAGGRLNCITGNCSFVGGGFANTITNSNSTIAGGQQNCVAVGNSAVGGGFCNRITGGGSGVIAGGCTNQVSTLFSGILGGVSNLVNSNGTNGVIGGGSGNTVSGAYGGILGGVSNSIGASYSCAFIVGSNIAADRSCTTFVNNLSIKSLPTAATGLPSGAVWKCTADNTLRIV